MFARFDYRTDAMKRLGTPGHDAKIGAFDRLREADMRQEHAIAEPSVWVCRFAGLVPPAGEVLDVACGAGRHARYLAALGMRVEALDRDAAALGTLAQVPGITTRCADIEAGPWPYGGRQFDAVVVTNYLHRPLLPLLVRCLRDCGVLLYETFMRGNERFGRPSNPAFLLEPGELLEAVRGELSVIAFEQGEVAWPRPAVVQRIASLRAPDASRVRLPE